MASPCKRPPPFLAREFQTPMGAYSGDYDYEPILTDLGLFDFIALATSSADNWRWTFVPCRVSSTACILVSPSGSRGRGSV